MIDLNVKNIDFLREECPFNKDELERVDYYISPVNVTGVVKLGKKYTLKNKEKYGQVIAVPWHILQELVATIAKGEVCKGIQE